MFIEKIKDKQIKEFFNSKYTSVQTIERKDDFIYVKLSIDAFGPYPEFKLKDFGCEALLNYKDTEKDVSKSWRKHLYNIFGEEYKLALEKNLENKKKEIISDLD